MTIKVRINSISGNNADTVMTWGQKFPQVIPMQFTKTEGTYYLGAEDVNGVWHLKLYKDTGVGIDPYDYVELEEYETFEPIGKL
jgi:hypothetical protein